MTEKKKTQKKSITIFVDKSKCYVAWMDILGKAEAAGGNGIVPAWGVTDTDVSLAQGGCVRNRPKEVGSI